MQEGPVLLVGHSWGGAVITEAGNHAQVKGLVYVAAGAPDSGQSFADWWKDYTPAPGAAEIKPYGEGYVALTPEGVCKHFVQDIPSDEADIVYATQGPLAVKCFSDKVTEAAWRSKPNWYIVAAQDETTAVACRALGFSLLFAREQVEADPILARGVTHADGMAATDFAAYGENPSILCRLGGGWVRSLMGSRDTALRMIGEGLGQARASGNPHPISWALGILALVHKLRCDAPSTKRAAAEAVEIARQHSLPQWLGFAELWLGWALGRLGQRAEGLALLQVAQRRLRDTGAVLFTVMSNWVLAEAGMLAGTPETALEHLAAAQEHAERYGEG